LLTFVNLIGGFDGEIFRGGNANTVVLIKIDDTENGAAQTCGAVDDRLENWLVVCWRTADDVSTQTRLQQAQAARQSVG
jgi:hypothetical protein